MLCEILTEVREMKDIKFKNICSITLEEAFEIWSQYKIAFIFKDGMLRGFSK